MVRGMGRGALRVPAVCTGKLALGGASFASMPRPARAIVWGPPALATMVTVPVVGPGAEGANVTLMVQLPPATRLKGQLLVWAKLPDAVMLVRPKALPLGLERVTARAVLALPTTSVANQRCDGATVMAAGSKPKTPTPLVVAM